VPTVRASDELHASAALALRLWSDLARWPTFVDGFGHVVDVSDDWPAVGAKVVWQSGPAGRGRVTERVLENEPDHFVTEVFEDHLSGRQALWIAPGGATIVLDYELQGGGPLRKLTDVLFIRRALGMALERTLRRFSTEAEDEAVL
jgi:hypothetical protein